MSKLTLRQYVIKLQKWRDRYDSNPDQSRTPRKPLQSISHWLAEFHHNKFEEPIEVPGQYIQVRHRSLTSISDLSNSFSTVQGHAPWIYSHPTLCFSCRL